MILGVYYLQVLAFTGCDQPDRMSLMTYNLNTEADCGYSEQSVS